MTSPLSPTATGARDDAEARLAPVLVVVALVLAALWAVSYALAHVLPHDAPMPEAMVRQYAVLPEILNPEPAERLIFLIDLALLAVLAPAITHVMPAALRPRWIVTAVLGILAFGATWALCSNQMLRIVLGMEDSVVPLLGAMGIAVLCLVRWRSLAMRQPLVTRIAFGLTFALAAYSAFSWRTFGASALQPQYRHYGNMEAVLYSITQSVGGRVPMVDYPAQYGFFGALLTPWFKAIGLSVWTFTLTMNLLLFAALLALLVVAYREIRSLPLAIAASATILFVTVAWAPLRFDPDPYFQYTPVRLLFPAVSVLLVSEWLRRPTRVLAVAISLVSGIALVWNLDSGVAVAGSWLALLAFRLVESLIAEGGDPGQSAKQAALAVVLVALPVVVFLGWVAIRATQPVDFSLAVQTTRTFYGSGVTMLPIPRGLHPWHVVAGVYVAGFVVACFHTLRGVGRDRRTHLITYLSILGLGTFVYYQGRSHDVVLIVASWPAVLLAFVLADRVWTATASGGLRRGNALIVALPTLAFGVLCGLLLLADLPAITKLSRANFDQPAWPGVVENIAFLRSHTTEEGQRDVVLIARFQAVYFAETGLVSSIRGPGVVETVTHAQGERLVRDIARLAPRQIFVGQGFLEARSFNPYNTLLPLLAEQYDLVERMRTEELRRYVRRDGRRVRPAS